MRWEIERGPCDCPYCRGRADKHAWAFYYFLKRRGDQPRVTTTASHIIVEVSNDPVGTDDP